MPRRPRIDIPGLIYHVMCRGIERREIFIDDRDREQLLARIAKHANKESIHMYAFSLMPNHFHLLVRPLSTCLAAFMRRVLTGYAIYFNRRHKRSGHLFQNRYKSFVIEEEAYLLELIRYIHLNPLRAGIVPNLKALATWPYCGYSALMGYVEKSWFEADYTLSLFDAEKLIARKKLSSFMEDGLGARRRGDFVGGGLKRSLGMRPGKAIYRDECREDMQHSIRRNEQNSIQQHNGQLDAQHQAYDERILGSGDFVQAVLSNLDKPTVEEEGNCLDINALIRVVLSFYGITLIELCSGSKRSAISKARSAIILLGIKHCKVLPVELAKILAISPSTVYSIISRGREEPESKIILDLY